MQRKEGKKGGLSKKESLLSEDLSRESKVSSSQVSIHGRRKFLKSEGGEAGSNTSTRPFD